MKFRRQYSIGPFIVDFYCPQLRLAIEIDGDSHDSEEAKNYDRRRTEFFSLYNIRVIRFTDREVIQSPMGVLRRLKEFVVPPRPSQARVTPS